MPADIDVRMYLALPVAHHNDGFGAIVESEEAAGIGDLAFMTNPDPVPVPVGLYVQLEDGRRGVEVARKGAAGLIAADDFIL